MMYVYENKQKYLPKVLIAYFLRAQYHTLLLYHFTDIYLFKIRCLLILYVLLQRV